MSYYSEKRERDLLTSIIGLARQIKDVAALLEKQNIPKRSTVSTLSSSTSLLRDLFERYLELKHHNQIERKE